MIPDVIHFVYLGGPFSLVHYLAVRSACVVNDPESIRCYCVQEPSGEWWERTRPYLDVVRIHPPSETSGIPLCHPAHQADLLRLQILRAQGGVYLDLDVVCVRPFKPLMDKRLVLGQQGAGGEEGLGNAVILSEPEAPFLSKWLEGFDPSTSLWQGFRSSGEDEYWDELSVRYPAFLARLYPEEVHVESYKRFYWPLYHPAHLRWLFEERGSFFEDAYCHHLWQSRSWGQYLANLTVERVVATETNFSAIARRFLSDELRQA